MMVWHKSGMEAAPRVWRRRLRLAALAVAALAVLAGAVGLEVSIVPTGSMEGTILIGDHILVNKLPYGPGLPFSRVRLVRWKRIGRGQVVSFHPPARKDVLFLKRVLAVGGDRVSVCGPQIFVNRTAGDDSGCVTYAVPHGRLFVVGDNRRHSEDSRVWGTVAEVDVVGAPVLVLWSYAGRTSDWLDARGNLRLSYYWTALTHLGSNTRWARTGLVL